MNISGKAVYEAKEINGTIKNYYEDKIDIDYIPGFEKEINFTVFNTDHRNMKVLLNIEGDLNDSAELSDKLVNFLPSELSKNFKYKIKIPEIKDPGFHSIRIVALFVPSTISGEGYSGSFSKKVSEVGIYVPYPGKYVEAEMNVLNAEQNSTAKLIIDIRNRGKLKINQVISNIDIFTILGEKVGSVKTDSKPLDIEEVSQLNADFNINFFPGDYIAKYNISYDGETRNFEKKFLVGAKNITIEGFLVNNFKLGEIAKLQILVDNKWNQKLDDVFSELLVYDKEGQIIADIKSASESIDALSKKELISYWDTAKVEGGNYNSRLSVKYGNQSSDKILILQVGQNSIEVFGVGYAIKPKLVSESTMTMILIILVVILLIANLSWFVFYKRLKLKNK
jgi:hypothetical protein